MIWTNQQEDVKWSYFLHEFTKTWSTMDPWVCIMVSVVYLYWLTITVTSPTNEEKKQSNAKYGVFETKVRSMLQGLWRRFTEMDNRQSIGRIKASNETGVGLQMCSSSTPHTAHNGGCWWGMPTMTVPQVRKLTAQETRPPTHKPTQQPPTSRYPPNASWLMALLGDGERLAKETNGEAESTVKHCIY